MISRMMINMKIPQELLDAGINEEILEELAERVHETWMASRIKEGWKYGPERNDARKETPCIVPYKDLPEIEKDYDRNTALTTLKFIIEKDFKLN